MSDWTIAANGITPFDPYSPMAKLAQIGQTNVQTQGGQIANQGALLGLQLQQARLAPFLGQQGGQGGGLASMAASSLGRPASDGLSAMAASGTSPVGAQPAAIPAAPGDIGQQVYGIPMPPLQAMSLAGEKDPAAALASVAKTRQNILYQYAASATPATWDNHITDLVQRGWLSGAQGSQLLGHPEMQPRILKSLASPDAGLSATTAQLGQGLTTDQNGNPVPSAAAIGARGAIAGAEKTGQNQSDLTYKPQIDEAENGPLANRARLTAEATLGTDVKKAQANPYNLEPGQTRVNPPIPGSLSSPAAPASIASGAMAPAALNSISNPNVRTMAMNAALQAGLPPAAWPAWISAVHNESGWRLTQPDGAAGEIGPGQIKPATGAMMGYTSDQLRTPQTNLLASAQYFKQQWAAAQGNPVGALRGYNGGNPGVAAAQPYADRAMQRAQKWAEGATPLAAAVDAPIQPASAVVPAPPTPPRPPAEGPSPFGPTPIVGSSAARRAGTGAAPSHADEQFPPDGTTVTPAGINVGPSTFAAPPSGQPGAFGGGYAPAQPVAAAAVPPIAPAATPPAQPLPGAPNVMPLPGGGTAVTSALTPAALEQQKADIGAMTGYRDKLLTDAQGATQMNSLLDGMRVEAQQYKQGGGLNEDWRDMQQSMSNVATFFGGKPFPEVANWEAFNKAAGQLVREAASTVSPRVGVQELQMVQKSLISDNTSPAGFQKIADQLQGLADFKIAKSAAASAARQGNPNAFEGDWSQHVTPLAFIVNRMPTADAQALAVQLNKTEQGKRTLDGLMRQMQYADQAGLFRAVQ